ncbi:MAG: hypothetical protein BWY51_00393 [Parcubacteria group bacterium ADurb.Bin316]|nr:MAG: hypothetical protein BWY51_00393 [Parcubacteria group bacterium ADurb.Bin316]HOZ56365.1 hypothetical protein [bacterium]
MYSSEIEFPNRKIEAVIKAPAGKFVIAELGKVKKGEAVIEGTFDDWLEAHQRVDELNKDEKGRQYAVFNDSGEKTRGPKDINSGLQQEEK